MTRSDLLAAGVDHQATDRLVGSGALVVVHRGVYTYGDRELTGHTQLLAACRAAGDRAVGSHHSAAWLHGLIGEAPPTPAVSIPWTERARLRGVHVHRSTDLERSAMQEMRGVRVTGAHRTLVDLAGVASVGVLAAAIDVGLAAGIVTASRLVDEAVLLAKQGRSGPPQLLGHLEQRGHIGAPEASVLEQISARLLWRWGFRGVTCQVVILEGRYRLDFVLAPMVALEVDGFAFHSSPEQKAADAARRNRLRAEGWTIIECDWFTVTHHPDELRVQICAVLEHLGLLPGTVKAMERA